MGTQNKFGNKWRSGDLDVTSKEKSLSDGI